MHREPRRLARRTYSGKHSPAPNSAQPYVCVESQTFVRWLGWSSLRHLSESKPLKWQAVTYGTNFTSRQNHWITYRSRASSTSSGAQPNEPWFKCVLRGSNGNWASSGVPNECALGWWSTVLRVSNLSHSMLLRCKEHISTVQFFALFNERECLSKVISCSLQ